MCYDKRVVSLDEAGECQIVKAELALKVRLSLEPAFQIIYWSICWLTFFISLIGILEGQHFSGISIFMSVTCLILLYFGLGSTLKLSKDSFELTYFRGFKKKSYSIFLLSKLVLSEQRTIQAEFADSAEPLVFYLNQKNKKKLITAIQQLAPAVLIETAEAINQV